MALANRVMGYGEPGLLCLNVEGRVRYANNFACSSLGYPLEDLMEKTFSDYTPDFSQERWGGHCKRTIENGVDSLYAYHQNCSGSRYPVQLRSIPHIVTETSEQLICTMVREASLSKRYITMLDTVENAKRVGSFDLNVLDGNILVSKNLLAMMGTQNPDDLRPTSMLRRLTGGTHEVNRWMADMERLRQSFHRMDDIYRIKTTADQEQQMNVIMWSEIERGKVSTIRGHYELVQDSEPEPLISLEENQRRHIISALRHTNGRVTGPNGAGKLLKINGKTLFARMKKLKINREDYTNR